LRANAAGQLEEHVSRPIVSVLTAIALLDAAPERPGGAVYRALRDDARFPLVVIGPGDGYEVVREEGDVDGTGGVAFINPFEVPPEADERFLAAWEAVGPVLARQHGFLGRRMHRATGDAPFRFVNLGRWSSPLMYARAVAQPEVEAAVAALDFPSHPALYLRQN
jgi:heme-degrading monooxygenase HmoA